MEKKLGTYPNDLSKKKINAQKIELITKKKQKVGYMHYISYELEIFQNKFIILKSEKDFEVFEMEKLLEDLLFFGDFIEIPVFVEKRLIFEGFEHFCFFEIFDGLIFDLDSKMIKLKIKTLIKYVFRENLGNDDKEILVQVLEHLKSLRYQDFIEELRDYLLSCDFLNNMQIEQFFRIFL